MRSALIALQFLTRLPVRLDPAPTPRERALSLLWYPCVGALLGLILWDAASALAAIPSLVSGALLLALWVLLTGALHLEGLADTADAWVGGHGDRERTLAIMKDIHSGPMAIVAVVCVLLLKFAALSAIAGTHFSAGLPLHLDRALAYGLAPLLARSTIPLLFATTPYVRPGGIGADLALHQSRTGNMLVALAGFALPALIGWKAMWPLATAIVVFALLRAAFLRRLGGVTGDCAGAMIELTEAAVVVSLAIVAA